LMLVLSIKVFSITDRVALGFTVAPGISWLKPMGNEIHTGLPGFGLQYGLNIEYYFKDRNYAISTGIFGGINDGGLRGRDTLTTLNSGRQVTERYNTNNLILPLYLKLKTNPIRGKFVLFGEVGFQMVFNVSARANYNADVPSPYAGGALISVDKENVLRNGNAVQSLIPDFRYQVFDFRISAGGGLEYRIHDRTALIFAIHYNNGFVPVINDRSVNSKHDATVSRNLLFTIGAMF
jgi:hypothetical protein